VIRRKTDQNSTYSHKEATENDDFVLGRPFCKYRLRKGGENDKISAEIPKETPAWID
jgi:hypothetical protein